jgi:hypothetical protein
MEILLYVAGLTYAASDDAGSSWATGLVASEHIFQSETAHDKGCAIGRNGDFSHSQAPLAWNGGDFGFLQSSLSLKPLQYEEAVNPD